MRNDGQQYFLPSSSRKIFPYQLVNFEKFIRDLFYILDKLDSAYFFRLFAYQKNCGMTVSSTLSFPNPRIGRDRRKLSGLSASRKIFPYKLVNFEKFIRDLFYVLDKLDSAYFFRNIRKSKKNCGMLHVPRRRIRKRKSREFGKDCYN